MQPPHHPATNANNTSFPASAAHMRSIDHHSLQDLLKRELRMTIMAKRQVRGKSEPQMEISDHPISHEITVVDLERKERRREQNRRAAQRCRRKKRMNQLSVLQNYEWIISRNQQLQHDVDQLRQDLSRLQSLLKAHRNACKCTHAQKGPLHPLATNVKTEPGECSPRPGAGFGTPPPVVHHQPPTALHPAPSPMAGASQGPASVSAHQYGAPSNENSVACAVAGPSMQQHQQQQYGTRLTGQQHGAVHSLPCGLSPPVSSSCSSSSLSSSQSSSLSRSSFGGCGNNVQHGGCGSSVQRVQNSCNGSFDILAGNDLPNKQPVPMAEGSCNMQEASHGHNSNYLPFQDGCRYLDSSVPAAQYGATEAGLTPSGHALRPGYHLNMLEELVLVPSALRSCVFQEGLSAPLSADGRRSISSVSSDVSSATSEVPTTTMTTEKHDDVAMSDFYVTEDVTPHDVSQLLSQINQSDLLFQHEGSLDEVFSDSIAGMASLPDHFLHHI